jgi:hypothetical protein
MTAKGDKAVTALLVRYADGRTLCNCRRAYEKSNKAGDHWWTCVGVPRPKPSTRYDPNKGCGCSAAQIYATQYIAEKALEEIEKLSKVNALNI